MEARDAAALAWVLDRWGEEQSFPSLSEIAAGVGYRSAASAASLLRRLAEAGFLERLPGRSRGYRFAGLDARPLAAALAGRLGLPAPPKRRRRACPRPAGPARP